jgi:hypothetical protein
VNHEVKIIRCYADDVRCISGTISHRYLSMIFKNSSLVVSFSSFFGWVLLNKLLISKQYLNLPNNEGT